jgi:hypothetical protein
MTSDRNQLARIAFARIVPSEERDLFTADIDDLPGYWREVVGSAVWRVKRVPIGTSCFVAIPRTLQGGLKPSKLCPV